MKKLILLFALVLCATFAMAEKRGSDAGIGTGGPIPPLQDAQCCRCCCPLIGCGCECKYCTLCPADRSGFGGSGATQWTMDNSSLDQLQGLGFRIYRNATTPPLQEVRVQTCSGAEWWKTHPVSITWKHWDAK